MLTSDENIVDINAEDAAAEAKPKRRSRKAAPAKAAKKLGAKRVIAEKRPLRKIRDLRSRRWCAVTVNAIPSLSFAEARRARRRGPRPTHPRPRGAPMPGT